MIIKIGIVLAVVIFAYLFLYSLARTSAEADEAAEIVFEKWLADNEKSA